ncbi:response regulator transcription factor [Altericroceibacterium xinjiangense]|uniref:response regulator transcription factor n=1 Tax=Altericroceibacterium xinjiangense TaxID=762261 RepID=UPI001F4930A2|nr:response regulator [Altericroceibacterium xinjiangense]
MSADEADAIAMPVILLVEDQVLIREMVIEALEEAGFATLVAGDGQGAIKLLEEKGSEIRGLMTDINLDDGMDGWELARTMREHDSDLPVVYVSGASGHEWASQGVPRSLMITKPFAPAQVVVAISSLLMASDTAP